MSILLVGSDGSQGKRYGAILKWLEQPFLKVDIGRQRIPDELIRQDVTGIILTTPTNTHVELIEKYASFDKPILVEKPITKDLGELRRLSRVPSLSMVYQYQYIARLKGNAASSYNYFRHGNDGLAWDCLQIIGLANGEVELRENSPIWTCKINGMNLDIGQMDFAYVLQIQEWLASPKQPHDFKTILRIHEKVAHYAEKLGG